MKIVKVYNRLINRVNSATLIQIIQFKLVKRSRQWMVIRTEMQISGYVESNLRINEQSDHLFYK
jgi:hypothetical protein